MSGHRYSEGFKARMVERMAMPGGPCATDLSREINVPGATLGRWLKAAGMVVGMAKKKAPMGEKPSSSPAPVEREPHGTREWTPMEKLRVVGAAAQLKDEELGEFLRREGIHLAQLEEWRSEILAALGRPAPRPKGPDVKRVRELEREIARKDRALAEVTAMLVLEKKLQALLGTSAGEGGSTDEENDKK
jgi:transposase-like protein